MHRQKKLTIVGLDRIHIVNGNAGKRMCLGLIVDKVVVPTKLCCNWLVRLQRTRQDLLPSEKSNDGVRTMIILLRWGNEIENVTKIVPQTRLSTYELV